MTDEIHDNPSNERPVAALSEDVGQLVRLAGPRAKIPPANLDRMQAELRPLWDELVDESRPDRRLALRLLAAAALVAVAVAATFFVRTGLHDGAALFATVERLNGSVSAWTNGGTEATESLTGGATLVTGQSVATSAEARIALGTVSGHSLRLDRDTRIALVSAREIRLEQGAVYVDSGASHHAAGPADPGLRVLTAFGRVEEIGTQFEVRLAADTLTVRVREGQISIDADGVDERGTPGEELIVAGRSVRRNRIDPSRNLFDWTQSIAPALAIDGSRLEAFLAWVAREGGYELVYSDEELAEEATSVVLSGEIEGLGPREALDVVLPAVGFSHRIDGHTLTISRPGAGTGPSN